MLQLSAPTEYGIGQCPRCHSPYHVTQAMVDGTDKRACPRCQGPELLPNGQRNTVSQEQFDAAMKTIEGLMAQMRQSGFTVGVPPAAAAPAYMSSAGV